MNNPTFAHRLRLARARLLTDAERIAKLIECLEVFVKLPISEKSPKGFSAAKDNAVDCLRDVRTR